MLSTSRNQLPPQGNPFPGTGRGKRGHSIAPRGRRRILFISSSEHRMWPRVTALGLLIAFTAIVLPARGQVASGFPAKPVKFIIALPGGGINDVLARIAADKLTAKWG